MKFYSVKHFLCDIISIIMFLQNMANVPKSDSEIFMIFSPDNGNDNEQLQCNENDKDQSDSTSSTNVNHSIS